jgi:GNAT superfamily N-acetyltransferase
MELNRQNLKAWAEQVKQKLGLEEFDLFLSDKGYIVLQMLAVPKNNRKSGIGTQAMQMLTQLADKHNMRIVLDLGQRDSNWGTTSRDRLIKFYKRFGFTRNFGRSKDFTLSYDMKREPIKSLKEKMSFKEFLYEAPIENYKLIGDWSKAGSFRDKRDRMLLQHPASIERLKRKFENSSYNFNMFFVNFKQKDWNRNYRLFGLEAGEVTPEWIKLHLGENLYIEVMSTQNLDDSINIIFTNNLGAERMNMSAWIIAHRLGHALARKDSMRKQYNYREASNFLINSFANIVEYYNGMKITAKSENDYFSFRDKISIRNQQLAMLYFFYEVATFKSARDRNIRDWFEILNELIAQYLTTGKIKFKQAPKFFGGRGRFRNNIAYRIKSEEDWQEVNDYLSSLARNMEYMIDNILSSMVGKILVM